MTSLTQEMERKGYKVRKKVSNKGSLASWKPPDWLWVNVGAEAVTGMGPSGRKEMKKEGDGCLEERAS